MRLLVIIGVLVAAINAVPVDPDTNIKDLIILVDPTPEPGYVPAEQGNRGLEVAREKNEGIDTQIISDPTPASKVGSETPDLDPEIPNNVPFNLEAFLAFSGFADPEPEEKLLTA